MDKEALYLVVDLSPLLTEATTDELQRAAVAAFPATTKRQHSVDTIRVANTTYTPSSVNKRKNLTVKGLVTNNGKKYDVIVSFSKVQYEPTDTTDNITFLATDGEQYHIQPISASKQNVKVRCTCLDFYHRFAMTNYSDGSLSGRKPPMYRRKTTTRPPANPTQSPGMCKHIMKFVNSLQRTGILVS